MSAETTMRSTLDGLGGLQLKVRMLEEDRDYHSNLQRGSEREYVQHKTQLDDLLRKQRRVHHERETALTRTLQHLGEEATMLRRALEEAIEQQERTSERIRREDDASREAKQMTIKAELAAARDEANQKEEEADRLRREVDALRTARDRKHARVQRLEADGRKLRLQVSAAAGKKPKSKVAHPFLPAGPSAKERVGMPTSQNVHSFAQTWHRAAMRTPGGDSPLGGRRIGGASPVRGASPTSARGGGGGGGGGAGLVSEEIEKKLKNELRTLYRQATMLATRLASVDPNQEDDGGAGNPISMQMKDIFNAIDQKQRQLNEMRNANMRLASADTLEMVNADAEQAKAAADATSSALLNALRSSSFVPE